MNRTIHIDKITQTDDRDLMKVDDVAFHNRTLFIRFNVEDGDQAE